MNDTQTAKTESTANLETELARLDANTKAWLERDNEPDSSHWQTMAIQHRRERDEAREYADKLAQGLPDGMLPKDVEVLREANLGLATELHEAREQRDRLAEALRKIANEDYRGNAPQSVFIARAALATLNQPEP